MPAWPYARTVFVAVLSLILVGVVSLFAAQPPVALPGAASGLTQPPESAAPVHPGPTLPLTVEWIKSMGADPGSVMSPLVLGDRLFITQNGTLRCFDPLTGAQYWQMSVKGARVSTAPIAWKDTVIVGVDNGLLMALSPKDGRSVWKTDCDGYIAPTPAVVGGVLVVGSERTVLGLDPANGKKKWLSMLTSGALYGPLSDAGAVFFRCLDGSVQSVETSNGHYRWRVTAPTGPESYPPLMVDHRVVLPEGRWLYSFSRTGLPSWTQEMPAGIGGPVTLQDDKLYVPCVDGRLYLLNPRSGRLTQRSVEYRINGSVTAPPVVTDKLIFVGTSEALIYALDRATGKVRWVYRCRAPEQPVDEPSVFGVYAPLVETNGNLIALSGTGDLYCFSGQAPDAAGPIFAALKPEPGEALSDATLAISFEVFDDGCGVAPDSVAVTVNGQSVKSKFDAASGKGQAFLSKPEDGIHLVKVQATDARGNQSTKEWSFLTDESLKPKAAATTPGGPNVPGGGPGRMGPGMMMPGMVGPG